MIPNKLISHETICAFYLTMFSLLAPITHTSGSSTNILLIALLICLTLNLFLVFIRKIRGRLRFLLFTSIIVGFSLLFDNAFRYNPFVPEAFYYFILYGVITIYFFSFVTDYYLFLKSYVILAISSGFLHALDPLTGYLWSNNYMEFGFVTMLPAFAASSIAVFYLKYKFASIPLVLFFLELLICSNKGSLLTAIVILMLSIVYISNNLQFNTKTFITLIFTCLVLYFSSNTLFQFAIKIADYFGIDSYSLTTIQSIINHGGIIGSSSDTRTPIWERAWNMYLNHPIIGNGIGYFYTHDKGYEHNLFLEILNSWGIIGFIILTIMLLKSLIYVVKMKNINRKVISIIFLTMSVIPLMVSMTFWKYQIFWAYLGICFCYPYKFNRII